MISLEEAMVQRHSVRAYTDKALPVDVRQTLQAAIEAENRASGLHIQLVTDEPKAFDGFMAHYGKFSGVRNYIALIGPKGAAAEESCGYRGERLVLLAQQLGLNTCWVALTYRKLRTAFTVLPGEKLHLVIAIGYGATQGVAHKSKAMAEVSHAEGAAPEWFRRGVEAALLAPTAMNQQKFTFTYANGSVTAKPGTGFYTRMDLGIAKYHFELGAGKAAWVNP